MFKRIQQLFCRHRFDYRDLIGRADVDGENVRWACWKCGKVFEDYCGLAIMYKGKVEENIKGRLV